MTGDWRATLIISLVAAIGAVGVLTLKSRLQGTQSDNPPVLRHVSAYVLAYVGGFAAFDTLERPWAFLVTAAVAALAFSVTINGRKPLATAAYGRTAATTFAVLLALLAVRQALLLVGIDLLAKDFVHRP